MSSFFDPPEPYHEDWIDPWEDENPFFCGDCSAFGTGDCPENESDKHASDCGKLRISGMPSHYAGPVCGDCKYFQNPKESCKLPWQGNGEWIPVSWQRKSVVCGAYDPRRPEGLTDDLIDPFEELKG